MVSKLNSLGSPKTWFSIMEVRLKALKANLVAMFRDLGFAWLHFRVTFLDDISSGTQHVRHCIYKFMVRESSAVRRTVYRMCQRFRTSFCQRLVGVRVDNCSALSKFSLIL